MGAQGGDHRLDRLEAFAAGQGIEPALDQIGLVALDPQAGALAGQGGQQVHVLRRHSRPASANFAAMMSPSNGFMMYSSAPASSASRMASILFSTVQKTTVGPWPPGS